MNRLRRRLLCDAASDCEEYQVRVVVQWHRFVVLLRKLEQLTPRKNSILFDVADDTLIASEGRCAAIGRLQG